MLENEPGASVLDALAHGVPLRWCMLLLGLRLQACASAAADFLDRELALKAAAFDTDFDSVTDLDRIMIARMEAHPRARTAGAPLIEARNQALEHFRAAFVSVLRNGTLSVTARKSFSERNWTLIDQVACRAIEMVDWSTGAIRVGNINFYDIRINLQHIDRLDAAAICLCPPEGPARQAFDLRGWLNPEMDPINFFGDRGTRKAGSPFDIACEALLGLLRSGHLIAFALDDDDIPTAAWKDAEVAQATSVLAAREQVAGANNTRKRKSSGTASREARKINEGAASQLEFGMAASRAKLRGGEWRDIRIRPLPSRVEELAAAAAPQPEIRTRTSGGRPVKTRWAIAAARALAWMNENGEDLSDRGAAEKMKTFLQKGFDQENEDISDSQLRDFVQLAAKAVRDMKSSGSKG